MTLDTTTCLADLLHQLRLLEPEQLDEVAHNLQARFPAPKALAAELIERDWLTPYQANLLLQGRGEELIVGPYILLSRLGEGGMGQVFKARHRNLGRVVALKRIRKERLASPIALRRFEREVRAAAALSHPNIVMAYDADQIGDAFFLVMEYVEAIDLAALVKKEGPLPIAAACDYIRQAALGLRHAFERGLVHRDIKPQNLLLTTNGKVVKVLDMGLARQDQSAGKSDLSDTMTQEGVIVGTPDYIAPEQALASHTVDIRADLYSLGCTFYFLLTGQVPFPGGTAMEKLLKHQLQEPDSPEQMRSDVPPGVTAVLRKLMAKRRDERYQTPDDVVAALTALNRATVPMASRVVPVLRPAASGETIASPFMDLAEDTVESMGPTRTTRKKRDDQGLRLLGVVGGSFLLLGLLGLLLVRFAWPSGKASARHDDDGSAAVIIPHPEQSSSFGAWVKRASALPAPEQLAEVTAKLKKLNHGFEGPVKHRLDAQGKVTYLELVTDKVADISPVRALTELRSLVCGGSAPGKGQLADLSPLKELPLTNLDCRNTQVSNLALLKGMELRSLNCAGTKVTKLAPIRDLKLTALNCAWTGVSDLAPLRGTGLTTLDCTGTKVTDLGPLADARLTTLNCSSTAVASLAPLKGTALKSLNCASTKVARLSGLEGTQLTELNCASTRVSSLSPLKGLKLTSLNCAHASVGNLTPLRGMPLLALWCNNTKVANLTPLTSCTKLKTLDCYLTKVTDLSPLKDLPLRELRCDFQLARDAEALRSIRTLHRINHTSAQDFWKKADKKRS